MHPFHLIKLIVLIMTALYGLSFCALVVPSRLPKVDSISMVAPASWLQNPGHKRTLFGVFQCSMCSMTRQALLSMLTQWWMDQRLPPMPMIVQLLAFDAVRCCIYFLCCYKREVQLKDISWL